MRPACPPLPPVIGHRGAAAYAPENTLAGIRAAQALGCRWVEFDVRLTADGTLVLCHDDRLERTTDGRGSIARLDLAAIRRSDAGGWFAPQFAGERVPTLDEAILLCSQLGLGANIEIKAERNRGRATAAAIGASLNGLVAPTLPLLISSFLADAVAEAAERIVRMPHAMLWRKLPRNWSKIAEQFGCAAVNADQVHLNRSLVAEVNAAGYPLLAYTVNDPDRARQLFEWGVTSVFSDAPDIILAATAPAGAADARRRAIC